MEISHRKVLDELGDGRGWSDHYHSQIRAQALNPPARITSPQRMEDLVTVLTSASATRLNNDEIPQPKATPAGMALQGIASVRLTITRMISSPVSRKSWARESLAKALVPPSVEMSVPIAARVVVHSASMTRVHRRRDFKCLAKEA